MEEKSINKPLRTSSNKARDIKDTYLKNEGKSMKKEESKQANIEEEIIENEEIQNDDDQETNQDSSDESLDLSEKIGKLEAEKSELKEQVIRKAAELENFRRRTIKEKQELIEFGNEKLLFKFLELLDDINNAVDAGKKTTDYEALLKGLEMIHNKAEKLFLDAGVKQMDDPAGEEFDVDYHEAMMHVPNNEIPEGYVVQVIQNGYMLNDKVLRHAKVVTSAGKSNE